MVGDLCELFDVALDLEFYAFLLAGRDGIPSWAVEYCDSWDSLEDVEPSSISYHRHTSNI